MYKKLFLLGVFFFASALSAPSAFAFVDLCQGTDTTDSSVQFGIPSEYRSATQFTLDSDCDLANIYIAVGPVGSPADGLDLCIRNDDTGVPDGSDLFCSTNTVDASELVSDPTWIQFLFASTTLNSGTPYWLVIKRSGGADGFNDYNGWGSNGSPWTKDNTAADETIWSDTINFRQSYSINGIFPDPVYGCMDSEADNYNPDATSDDESCFFTPRTGVADTQRNLWFAYWTFFATLVFVVWLFRSTR